MRCLVRVLACGLAAAVMATPAMAAGIRVLSAQYGDPQSSQLCNAAAPIAALCDGHQSCSFDVRNTALCGDPSFLVVKQLAVTYTCGVGLYKTKASEYAEATLACQ